MRSYSVGRPRDRREVSDGLTRRSSSRLSVVRTWRSEASGFGIFIRPQHFHELLRVAAIAVEEAKASEEEPVNAREQPEMVDRP